MHLQNNNANNKNVVRRFTRLRASSFRIPYFHTVCLLVCGLLLSPFASAVGLGEVQLQSALGEPLQARITLVAPGDLTTDEMIVRHVSGTEAEALGMQLVDSFHAYRLTPQMSGGVLSIALSTSDPINEPYINLLIELRWPKGQVMREYTLLLDLPVAANVAQSTPTPRANAIPERKSPMSPPPVPVGEGRYRVVPGDTLSGIANRISASINHSSADIAQWLLAENPGAFINQDPDRIKAGSVLALPDDVALTALGGTTDKTLFRPRGAVVAATDDAAVAGDDPPVVSDNAVLRITSLNKASPNSAEHDLMAQLASTREVIDQLRRENRELQARLERIERSGYEASLQKLVDLKDEQIFELKRQVRVLKEENAVMASQELGENRVIGLDGQPPAESVREYAADTPDNMMAYIVLGLVFLTIVGSVIWMRMRVGTVEPVSVLGPAAELDEKAVLDELQKVAKTQTRPPQRTGSSQGRRDSRWRPDDEVKRDIEEKMRAYAPQTDSDDYDEGPSELDERIAEALAYATAGKFDLAEAILISGQIDSGNDPKLDDALHYVEKLREKNG